LGVIATVWPVPGKGIAAVTVLLAVSMTDM
jgi:hypothetical protein